ncbi:MAG: hypothetical protein IT546_10760 [Caulobacteraceae bacterium]|nr:hypothetical protein [Caulobacteraceae bacterium]
MMAFRAALSLWFLLVPAAAFGSECPPFDQVAVDRLPTTWETFDGTAFETAWTDWARHHDNAPMRGADGGKAQFRLSTTVPGPGIVSYDLRGRKLSKDGWKIEARRRGYAGPRSYSSGWRRVKLSVDASRKIDELLADRCFWSAPRFLDDRLPLIAGGYAQSIHQATTFFDIRVGNRDWRGIHVSWVIGRPGELRSLLTDAAFGDPGLMNDRLERWPDS